MRLSVVLVVRVVEDNISPLLSVATTVALEVVYIMVPKVELVIGGGFLV